MDSWLAELCATTPGQVEITARTVAYQFHISREKASYWLQKFTEWQVYGHSTVILRVNTKVGIMARWVVTLRVQVAKDQVIRQAIAVMDDSKARKKVDFQREVFPGASPELTGLLKAICTQVVAGKMTEESARELILAL